MASSGIIRSTAELGQKIDKITTQSNALAMIAQLNMSVKSSQDNVAFHQAVEDSLKS